MPTPTKSKVVIATIAIISGGGLATPVPVTLPCATIEYTTTAAPVPYRNLGELGGIEAAISVEGSIVREQIKWWFRPQTPIKACITTTLPLLQLIDNEVTVEIKIRSFAIDYNRDRVYSEYSEPSTITYAALELL